MTGPDFQTLDDGRMLAGVEFVSILRANGFDTFEKVMAFAGGEIMRSVPGRSTVRIELETLAGGKVALYLKRFEPAYLSPVHWLLRFLRWPGADDEAMREWRKIFRLRAHGLLTAEPVAVGQQRGAGVVTRSFVMTREIGGGVSADRYWAGPLRGESVERRWRWLAEVGAVARRFQQARFVHKDFYLSHLFVVEAGGGWWFHLIDLQRVLGPHWHRRRWYVKDLVALAFSARAKAQCSRTDLLRLYKGYAGVTRLRPSDKPLLTKLWRGVQGLERRRPRYARIWNQPKKSS